MSDTEPVDFAFSDEFERIALYQNGQALRGAIEMTYEQALIIAKLIILKCSRQKGPIQ